MGARDESTGHRAPRQRRSFRRLPGLGVFAGLTLGLAVSAFGDTPDPRSTTEEIASYYTRHRVDVFIGVVMLGIALMAMIVVVSGLAADLHRGGRESTARVAQSSATVVVGVIVMGMLVPYAGLSYIIGAEAPEAAKGVFALTILTSPLCAMPLGVCLGAIAVGFRRARLGRPWFVWLTGVAALFMAVAACSFAGSGAFSPDVQQQVLFQVLIIWLILSAFGRSSRGRPARC